VCDYDSIISVFKKGPQIRLLTAYARLLRRVAKFA
jgi:hypothetical protein